MTLGKTMKRIIILIFAVLWGLTARASILVTFTAAETDSGVVVNWSTEGELNCLSWRLERSLVIDTNYQTMTTQPGQGTTSIPHDYTWLDTTVVAVNTYYYRLVEISTIGGTTYNGPISVLVSLFGVAGEPEALPLLPEDILLQSHPNPFWNNTRITYNLARPGPVSIKVYNTAGQLIRVLSDGFQAAGRHSEAWNGRDRRNKAVANGVYICHLVTGKKLSQCRIILVK
jgi:hypothetical protein